MKFYFTIVFALRHYQKKWKMMLMRRESLCGTTSSSLARQPFLSHSLPYKILAVIWRNKYLVVLLSIFHTGSKNEVTEVPSKYPNKPSILKPNAVFDYSKHMEEVNCIEHYIS
jgi:hypothetical protein